MNLYHKNRSSGFTMVELLVTLGIVGLIAGVSGWYIFAGKAESTTASRNIYFLEARKGLTRISSELRNCRQIQSVLDEKGIEFRGENDGIISIALAGNEIVRTEDQKSEVLASNVVAFHVKPIPPVIRKTMDIMITCGPEGSSPGDNNSISLNTAIFIR